jgi:serine/threonine protein kinase
MRTLKIGTKMGGYQLLGLIARGGMGAVYEALELALERKVALKVIAPPNPGDHDADELVQRFMQEARTLARVNHPNVITIYAIDTAESVPFITMELVEGISFKELLAVSFLSADLAAPMFIQMLEGLQSLHANRIVHRDLKPHNVMVRKDGQIKILDFGIAKPADAGNFTHVGVVVGSLAYMAPEVKLGIAATERSDLWNLGAIFYDCLTGKALPKVLAENPNAKEIPYAANSPIPHEMRAIIAKLCHQRPLERYENCELAIEDLKAFQRKRTPVTPDVMHAFTRKVEEILAKRRGDSRDLPAADVTPVQAALMPDSPSSLSSYRRERAYTPRERRKKPKWNPRHVGAGILGAILLLTFLLKPKFDAQKTPAVPPAVPVAHEDPKPLKFKPPPAEKAKPAPVELVSPESDETVQLDPSAIPTLAWSRDLKRDEFTIQISTDRAFRKILVDEPVSGTKFRPGRVLPEGHYYWRMLPRNSDAVPVGPRRFTLAHLTPVDLEAPAGDADFEYGTREKGAAVDFTWKCKPSAEAYQIQIAVGPKFVSRENGTSDCGWHENALAAGTYRWRVRALGKGALWSDSREFTVTRKAAAPVKPAPLALGRPALDESDDKFTLKFKGSPRDLASVAKAIVDYPSFKWRPVKGAKKYLFQLSADKNFAKAVAEEKLSNTKFEWKSVTPGQYYWRVAALGDKQGPFSERGQLTVLLPAPKLKTKYKFETLLEGDKQVVNWPFVPLAEKYLVQFGPKRDLAADEPQLTGASKFPLPKKHGQYFIRVAAANADGEALSAYSATSSVAVEPVATLDTPELKSPKAGAATVARGGRVAISFEWSKIAGAERYIIELAGDEDFTEVIEKIPSMEISHVLRKLNATGKIFWRVRAESRQGVSSWSEPSYFEIRK